MAEEEADNLDSWEEQADSGVLDRRLEEMTLGLKNKEEKKKQSSNPSALPDGVILSEDTGRTPYQPQVRILRREAKSPGNLTQNHSNILGATNVPKSSKHGKSLQQREAEYAEARLRIFGSLPPPDDDDDFDNDGDDDGEVVCDETPKIYDSSIQSSPQIIKPDSSLPHVTVLRQPQGPDGTNGFTKSHPT